MTKEDIVHIHLPDGNVYEVVLKVTEKVLTDDQITQLRQLFGGSSTSNIEVKVKEKDNALIKSKVLILWGETLKNSYITINRY